MPKMQLTITLTVGDRRYSVDTERDADMLLCSSGPLAAESALVGSVDELRRLLAVKVDADKRNGRGEPYVSWLGLGDK